MDKKGSEVTQALLWIIVAVFVIAVGFFLIAKYGKGITNLFGGIFG
jgi:hypothetical protein